MSQFGRNANHSASDLTPKTKPMSRSLRRNRFDSGTSPKAMDSSKPATSSNNSSSLLRQNQELQHRLQEDAALYRRRLDTYKQAQQNQAALVARLQSKVLQYKKKCNELEERMCDTPDPSDHGRPIKPCPGSSYTGSYPPQISLPCMTTVDQNKEFKPTCVQDDIFNKLDCDKLKVEHLLANNEKLRQQLEESHRTNLSLTNDLHKLTIDWGHLRDELAHKEDEWKEEEQAFNDYYSSEQNRLVEMWQDVGSVRKSFRDLQNILKSDLNRMQQEISGVNRELANACGAVAETVRQNVQNDEAYQMQMERTNNELKSQIDALKLQSEAFKHDIAQRDQRMKDMLVDLKNWEARCIDAENNAAQNTRLYDEIDRLTTALREIAHIVVQDAESKQDGNFIDAQHMHLTQSMPIPPKSPKRGGVRTSQAFAEGTISAVQAALHKYQLVIHDLQVNLETNANELHATQKQFEESQNTRDVLTSKLMTLTNKMDATNNQLSELFKERESLQRSLEGLRNEKHMVNKEKVELSLQFDALNVDYEKLQSAKSNLQKLYDMLAEEKKMLELDLQCVRKDKDITEMNLRAEENRSGNLREDAIMLREELNKLYLARDLLEQQRIESEEMLVISEKQRADLECRLERLHLESSDVKYQLEKSSSSNSDITQEVKELNTKLNELEVERGNLKAQIEDHASDIMALKKELVSAEQIRLDLDAEKMSITEKLKICEINREKVEMDLSHVVRERGDLGNQLIAMTNKKDQMGEELMRIQQRFKQANECNDRLNRNLENLMKENEDKLILIEAHEKEIQRQQEHFAALRSEKESLEGILFDTNTNLEASQNRCDQLDREVHDLISKQETMKNRISQLAKDLENSDRRLQETKNQMNNALSNQEAEFLQKVNYLKSLGEDNLKKWNDEKEQLKNAAESRLHSSLQALEVSKDSEIFALKERLESLQLHLDSICQQHEEVLIRCENEKQQALLLAHRDKQAVADKLEQTQRELKTEIENLDRTRREGTAKTDRDRNVIKQLNEDLSKLKTKCEEQKLKVEEELRKIDLMLSSMTSERDIALKEVENTKIQLGLSEDRTNGITAQLQDTNRKLKEFENLSDGLRKELTDVKRALAECNIERDKYVSTNKELRDHIKCAEGQRREQSRNLEEAVQKIVSLEESKNSLENDRTRIATMLKETQNSMTKLNQEHSAALANIQKLQQSAGKKDVMETELQARLCNETEERERTQQELTQLKKQLSELDETLENTRQELGRTRCKANQDEHRWHAREQELLGRLEEGRGREKCLEDQKHNLEVCLADATQQIQELKARLGGAESRVRALDEQLMQMESCKKDIEHKLTSVLHTLKRIAGIQFDGTITAPHRLLSPSRRYSPARSGMDYDGRSVSGECCLFDIDPEMIRKSVRKLMLEVGKVEREKEEYKVQLQSARKELEEAANQQTRCENKMAKLQNVLRNVNEEKANLESKLTQKHLALQSVEEALKTKTDELNALTDKYKSLDLQLSSVSEQKAQIEDRLEKTKQNEIKLEKEKRHLLDEIARFDGRNNKLDLQRIALDGDIQRLQMTLQEKDNHLRNCQERLENQQRSSGQLEDRCVALKTSVDQLKERLQNAAIIETELRGELNCIQKERTDQNHLVTATQEKLKHMQKTVSNSENERRILSDRLDSSQSTLNELHRSQQSQQDVIQRLQNQVADLEVQKSTIEAQLRIAKWNQGNNDPDGCAHNVDDISSQLLKTQREKNELRLRVEMLNEKLRQVESDKLSKFSESRPYDCPEKMPNYEYDSNKMADSNRKSCNDPEHNYLKQENHDIKIKIRRLETMLAEKEAELARLRTKLIDSSKCPIDDLEKYRAAQLKSERLFDIRETHHRQQITQLENQISMLKEQLAQEAKRRQMYILRSSRAGQEMKQLRQTLGDSLRHIAQDPVDSDLLENEARRLDSAVSLSLPPTTNLGTTHYDAGRNLSPRY